MNSADLRSVDVSHVHKPIEETQAMTNDRHEQRGQQILPTRLLAFWFPKAHDPHDEQRDDVDRPDDRRAQRAGDRGHEDQRRAAGEAGARRDVLRATQSLMLAL